jgi:hypothetical protein
MSETYLLHVSVEYTPAYVITSRVAVASVSARVLIVIARRRWIIRNRNRNAVFNCNGSGHQCSQTDRW